MKTFRIIRLYLAVLLLIVITGCNEKQTVTTSPNFVFILADDLGIECLSSYGGTSHETPNIER